MQIKDFVIENGQMYYKQKPLYRQPLFWTTIAGAILSFVLGVTCFLLLLGYSAIETSDQTYPDVLDESITYTEYQVGESVEFYDGLEVTVTSMGKDSSVDLVDDYYSSAYVVEMDVRNTTDSDYYFDEYYFSLVDLGTETSFLLDLRTYDVNLLEKIPAGETVSVKLIYGVDYETNFAFTYDDAMWVELIAEGV